MPNVKPGDLCLVVGMDHTVEMNGKVVSVIRKAVDGENFVSITGSQHIFKSDELCWVVSGNESLPWRNTNDSKLTYHSERAVGDEFLIKIKDGDLTLDEETEISNNTSKTKEKENQC